MEVAARGSLREVIPVFEISGRRGTADSASEVSAVLGEAAAPVVMHLSRHEPVLPIRPQPKGICARQRHDGTVVNKNARRRLLRLPPLLPSAYGF
jgi:hypothetical protein